MHYIRVHVGNIFIECGDALSKIAMDRQFVDVEVNVT